MRRSLLVAAVLTAAASFAFAGGQQAEASAEVKELTLFEGFDQAKSQLYTTFAENPLYTELEKRTGVTIKWISPPEGQFDEKFNLMIASGDLTDMIYRGWSSYPGGPEKAISDEVIIQLNDVIKNYMPNLNQVYVDNPDWLRAAKTDTSKLYHIPFIRGRFFDGDALLLVFNGPILRKDWLDELGLDVPETIDEWETVLRAFKSKCEYPWTSTDLKNGGRNVATGSAWMSAYDVAWKWYVQDGKVKWGNAEQGYKGYLALMNKWYKEGLADPEFFTNDRKAFEAKVLNYTSGVFSGYTGSNMGVFLDAMKEKDPNFALVAAPYPTLKKGDVAFFGQRDTYMRDTGLGITTACKSVETATKWADYAYSDEGYILYNFGIEGESFNWVDVKEIDPPHPLYETYSTNGKFPMYSDLVYNNPDGLGVSQVLYNYTRASFSGPNIQAPEYLLGYLERDVQKDACFTWAKTEAEEHQYPPMATPTPEESEELAVIETEMNTYMEEMFVKFISGAEPLDNFNSYVDTLKKMGLEKAIAIKQAAYDRYMAR